MTTAVQPYKPIIIRLPALMQEIQLSSEWIVNRNKLVAESAGVEVVADQASYDGACKMLSDLTKLSNALESMRKKLAEPFREADKTIKSAADHAREPLEAEKERLKQLTAKYAEEQRKAAAAERERIEAEQRMQIEAQLAKRQDEIELGLAGEEETFQPKIETIAPVVEAPRSVAARVIERVVWECVNEDVVPRNYLALDPRKVNEYVRRNGDWLKQMIADGKGAKMVDGLVFAIKTDVAAR